MKRIIPFFLILIMFGLVTSACDSLGIGDSTPTEAATAAPTAAPMAEPSTSTPPPAPNAGIVVVESLEILTSDSTPPEINARVRGLLPDGCTTIKDLNTTLEGDTFNIEVTTAQLAAADCEAAGANFDEIVTLETNGLPTGTYSVVAGERQGSFTMHPDSETPAAEAEATETAPVTSISGLVWHDTCRPDEAADGEVPPGCLPSEDGTLIADGLLQDEPGIAGLRVGIARGECPAVAFADTLTAGNGTYSFTELNPGTYCIFIDEAEEGNQAILVEGIWTSPVGGVPQLTVTLPAGEAVTAVDFGWDYLGLPPGEVDLANCENSFEYVDDLTVPDDTAVPPGGEFTKTWLLRNNGTCPWSTEYSIVFVGGEPMSGEEPLPLEETVAPGAELEVSIPMVAPDEPGTYRGNYQIAAADGEPFGINGLIEDAFWLQIVVEEGATAPATPLPNSATIGGIVWEDLCRNSDPGRGCVEFPEGSGNFIADGSLNAGEPLLSGIRIVLAAGACPTDGTFPTDDTILNEVLTGDDGLYRFENLPDETYCVFMDALAEATLDLLIPGNWTWPATGVGLYTFILDPGEQALDLDFGWDYQD